MPLRSDKSWTRSAAEGATIVASILLAFGIDAWWDAAQARQDALDSLSRVVAEVVQARTEINRARQYQLRFQATNNLLRNAVLEAPPGSIVQVSDTLLYGVLMSQVMEVPMSNVSSFVASESFELIDDVELRATVGRWVPTLQDLQDDQLIIRRLKDEVIKPTLRLDSDLARAQGLTNSWTILRESVDPTAIGETEVRASPALRSLLVELSGLYGLDSRQTDEVLQLAIEIETHGRLALGR